MAEPSQQIKTRRGSDFSLKNLGIVAGLTLLGMLVMGYHPGLEDDSFYLAAIKRDLNPLLFPHDADFFRLQFQATIFDKLIAASSRLTHLPLAWMILFWQFAALFLVLHGVWRISRRCFSVPEARWGATAMIAALLTLPLPGIAISIADQYLHPRTLATAAILAAIVAVLDRRLMLAGVLLTAAFSVHAIMASFGISFCAFLFWTLRSGSLQAPAVSVMAALLLPLNWLFQPSSDAWRQAAATRGFYFILRWQWYEWLGIVAPLGLLYMFLRFLRRDETASPDSNLLPFASALFYYGVFQTAIGLLLMLPPGLERLRPFEPMRYLHLLYLLFFLIAGGLIARHVLKRQLYRWLLLFVPLGAGMFIAQREMYAASSHLELPSRAEQNSWLQAFNWIRQETPTDVLFGLDPHYETLPGEDAHGFRAFAERSALADYEKDGGMAARVPPLAPRWLREVTALNRWKNFNAADFTRLKRDFGVNWVMLSRADAEFAKPSSDVMTCPYSNQDIRVCRLY